MEESLVIAPSREYIEVDVPTSKSYANRLLILGALSEDLMTIEDLSDSSDVSTLLQCLVKIGVTVLRQGKYLKIFGPFPQCERKSDEVIDLHTGDGGTTNRFLLPLLARGKNTYRVIPSEKLKDRPQDTLLDELKKMNVSIELASKQESHWLTISGRNAKWPQSASEVTVDCSTSTQFASGLLLAAADLHLKIIPLKLKSSLAYWKMSEEVVSKWKEGKRVFRVPVDASSLSYPLAYGAVSKGVRIKNCHEIDMTQADSALLGLFSQWGIEYQLDDEGLKLHAGTIPAFSFDCSGCPDLAPTLAFLATFAEGPCTLSGLSVLRHKESDRLAEICRLLTEFSIPFTLSENDSQIRIEQGKITSEFVEYLPPADHRMVMVGYLFMRCHNGGKLHQVHHVAKSFPAFFDQLGH